MRKTIKWVVIGLTAVFASIQLVQPERTNPPVDESKTIFATLKVPGDVRAIFERACFDCHSHNTHWPWYSYVAPTSWLTAGDVKHGRANMNFSLWGDYPKRRQITKLGQISDQLSNDEMPLKPYRLMHPAAVLSKAEIDRVVQWANSTHDDLMGVDSTGSAEQK